MTGSGSASGEPAASGPAQSSLPIPPQSEIGLGGSQKGEAEVLEAESVLESVAEEEKNKKTRKELDGKSPVGGVWHIDFLRGLSRDYRM